MQRKRGAVLAYAAGFDRTFLSGQILPDMPACPAHSLRVRRFPSPLPLPFAESLGADEAGGEWDKVKESGESA